MKDVNRQQHARKCPSARWGEWVCIQREKGCWARFSLCCVQDQEEESEAGRGSSVSEHGQGILTPGQQQEPGAAAERQHGLLAGECLQRHQNLFSCRITL